MEIIVFEKESYYRMMRELTGMFEEALKAANKVEDDWISTEEAKKLLKVRSKSKMQQLRDFMLIKFTQPSRKVIQYSRKSILAYLESKVPKY